MRARGCSCRFEKELFSHIDTLEGNNQKRRQGARDWCATACRIAPVFAKHKFMLGEDFSMLNGDHPLLWRSTTTASNS
jgi:RNA polymerase-associated protein